MTLKFRNTTINALDNQIISFQTKTFAQE